MDKLTYEDKIIHGIQNDLDNDYNTQDKVKENGEVFTPFSRINKNLDRFSEDVWKNPENVWMDRSAGLGNFHSVVLKRLMVGLAKWEPNDEKRRKHIIENMLYFVELNRESYKKIKHRFDPENKYNMNLVCADALDKNHSGWNKTGYKWNYSQDRRLPLLRYVNEHFGKIITKCDVDIEKTLKIREKSLLKINKYKTRVKRFFDVELKNDPKEREFFYNRIDEITSKYIKPSVRELLIEENKKLESCLRKLEVENKKLKNKVNTLKKENEKLKKENEQLRGMGKSKNTIKTKIWNPNWFNSIS